MSWPTTATDDRRSFVVLILTLNVLPMRSVSGLEFM